MSRRGVGASAPGQQDTSSSGGGRLRQAGAIAAVLVTLACGQGNATEPTQTASVAEAGWSFGFCLGPCQGRLSFDGLAVGYTITSREGSTFADNRGTLTGSGAERLAGLVAELPTSLASRYGCPDCADGGAAFFELQGAGPRRRVEYEYRSAPPQLLALDAELSGIMEALSSCRATDAVTPAVGCAVFER